MSHDKKIEGSIWTQWMLVQVYPQLRAWPVAEWSLVLAKARTTRFDGIEQFWTFVGVIVAAMIVQPASSLDSDEMARFFSRIFLAAIVLVLALVPFFIRRTRRGLEAAIAERDAQAPESGRNA